MGENGGLNGSILYCSYINDHQWQKTGISDLSSMMNQKITFILIYLLSSCHFRAFGGSIWGIRYQKTPIFSEIRASGSNSPYISNFTPETLNRIRKYMFLLVFHIIYTSQMIRTGRKWIKMAKMAEIRKMSP